MNRYFFLILNFAMVSIPALAALDGTRVHTADPKKTQTYLREGLVIGGDRKISQVEIKEIRRAMNAGFERIVLDLKAPATPYYQVALEPEMKRVVFTIYGTSHLTFDPNKILSAFKKSTHVTRLELFPKLDESSWSFALYFKEAPLVEVFELSAPTRIIFDVKTKTAAAGVPKDLTREIPDDSTEVDEDDEE